MERELFGRNRVPAFFEAISSSVDTELFAPEEFIAQSDKLVVTRRYGAKVKSTGKSFAFDWVMIWTLKITRSQVAFSSWTVRQP